MELKNRPVVKRPIDESGLREERTKVQRPGQDQRRLRLEQGECAWRRSKVPSDSDARERAQRGVEISLEDGPPGTDQGNGQLTCFAADSRSVREDCISSYSAFCCGGHTNATCP